MVERGVCGGRSCRAPRVHAAGAYARALVPRRLAIGRKGGGMPFGCLPTTDQCLQNNPKDRRVPHGWSPVVIRKLERGQSDGDSSSADGTHTPSSAVDTGCLHQRVGGSRQASCCQVAPLPPVHRAAARTSMLPTTVGPQVRAGLSDSKTLTFQTPTHFTCSKSSSLGSRGRARGLSSLPPAPQSVSASTLQVPPARHWP